MEAQSALFVKLPEPNHGLSEQSQPASLAGMFSSRPHRDQVGGKFLPFARRPQGGTIGRTLVPRRNWGEQEPRNKVCGAVLATSLADTEFAAKLPPIYLISKTRGKMCRFSPKYCWSANRGTRRPSQALCAGSRCDDGIRAAERSLRRRRLIFCRKAFEYSPLCSARFPSSFMWTSSSRSATVINPCL
jgi:hypothetical protein